MIKLLLLIIIFICGVAFGVYASEKGWIISILKDQNHDRT